MTKPKTLDDIRHVVAEFLQTSPDAGKFWDLMTALRGPDFPSERGGMSSQEAAHAYSLRRKRKYDTVEVIRQKAFFGVIGGAARSHDDDHVTLPPPTMWDHFDRHVQRGAGVVGLRIETRKVEDEDDQN